MITKIGEVVERVTTAAQQYNLTPHSTVVVRVGSSDRKWKSNTSSSKAASMARSWFCRCPRDES